MHFITQTDFGESVRFALVPLCQPIIGMYNGAQATKTRDDLVVVVVAWADSFGEARRRQASSVEGALRQHGVSACHAYLPFEVRGGKRFVCVFSNVLDMIRSCFFDVSICHAGEKGICKLFSGFIVCGAAKFSLTIIYCPLSISWAGHFGTSAVRRSR